MKKQKVPNVDSSTIHRASVSFRRRARESLDDWLSRSSDTLAQLFAEATEFDQKMKLLEAAGKLAERFGKYTGLEKIEPVAPSPAVVIDFGGMSIEERKSLLEEMQRNSERGGAV